MAKFNADSFLNQTVEKVLDTKRIPMPEGDHDELVVKDLAVTSGTGKESGNLWVRLKAKLVCTDPNIKAEMKLTGDAEPTVYWEEFINIDEDGNLDTSDGQNIKLGKLRQACGQNSSEEWSINDLKGAVLGARIKWAFNGDGDPYAVVSSVYNPAGDESEED